MSQNWSVNFHFKVLIIQNTIKVKLLPSISKILMSKFCEIVFCVPLLFRRHVCLSNLKHTPSRELPLTARKTVFSHLKSWKLLSQVLSLISTFPRNLILVLFLKRSRKLWALLQKLPKIYLPFAKAHSATYIKSPLTSKFSKQRP